MNGAEKGWEIDKQVDRQNQSEGQRESDSDRQRRCVEEEVIQTEVA